MDVECRDTLKDYIHLRQKKKREKIKNLEEKEVCFVYKEEVYNLRPVHVRLPCVIGKNFFFFHFLFFFSTCTSIYLSIYFFFIARFLVSLQGLFLSLQSIGLMGFLSARARLNTLSNQQTLTQEPAFPKKEITFLATYTVSVYTSLPKRNSRKLKKNNSKLQM